MVILTFSISHVTHSSQASVLQHATIPHPDKIVDPRTSLDFRDQRYVISPGTGQQPLKCTAKAMIHPVVCFVSLTQESWISEPTLLYVAHILDAASAGMLSRSCKSTINAAGWHVIPQFTIFFLLTDVLGAFASSDGFKC